MELSTNLGNNMNRARVMHYLLKISSNTGHVKAEHDVSIEVKLTRHENCSTIADVTVKFMTKVTEKYKYSNSKLQAHEDQHVIIYEKYKEKKNDLSYRLAEKIANEEACEEIKTYTWPYVKNALTDLINEQNKWDDEDVNNVSKERISLDKEVDNLKNLFNAKSCTYL